MAWSAEERRGLVAEWERSGQTQAAFCEEQGIALWTFRSWRYKGAGLASSDRQQFVEVAVPEVGSASFEVVLKCGVVVRVPPKFERNALRELVRALES